MWCVRRRAIPNGLRPQANDRSLNDPKADYSPLSNLKEIPRRIR
jgi:hypothetical protein